MEPHGAEAEQEASSGEGYCGREMDAPVGTPSWLGPQLLRDGVSPQGMPVRVTLETEDANWEERKLDTKACRESAAQVATDSPVCLSACLLTCEGTAPKTSGSIIYQHTCLCMYNPYVSSRQLHACLCMYNLHVPSLPAARLPEVILAASITYLSLISLFSYLCL